MIAVISDVHANIAALKRVLRDIDRRGIDEIYCLGDCVGYSSAPEETIALLREEGVVSIKGNHDMMATGELPIEHCGPNGRASQLWTRKILSPETRRYLMSLPSEHRIDPDIFLMHSRLDDPVGYLIGETEYRDQYMELTKRRPFARICFTGHTHKPRLVEMREDGAIRFLASGSGATVLDPERFYFINPGSVGHPRRSDYRARYAVFDRDTGFLQWIRVAYDKSATLAANLQHGIHTDLGPGVIRHSLRRWTMRWKERLGVSA